MIVNLDRLEESPEFLQSETDLRLFRRVIGGLVLYEITPGEEPLVLPRVYRLDVAEQPAPDLSDPGQTDPDLPGAD